jgi:hypothetical protein
MTGVGGRPDPAMTGVDGRPVPAMTAVDGRPEHVLGCAFGPSRGPAMTGQGQPVRSSTLAIHLQRGEEG